MGFLKSLLVSLPTSASLSYAWNFGSLLGIVLVSQLVSGTLLALCYSTEASFDAVQFIILEVNFGWLIRLVHFNGASFFFAILYLHLFKALFAGSYRLVGVWLTGLLLFLGFILVAFAGYVLVWAQISFWAAVVISSLLSVIPYLGQPLLFWVWGGFTVGSSTLKLFFVAHFLVPYALLLVVLSHLIQLHITGSSNVLGVHGSDAVAFYPFFWVKDALNLVAFIIFFVFLLTHPFSLGDPEMFIEANPSSSPVHIVPEWYFLPFYAVLRAVPNKLAGVVALLAAILSLLLLPIGVSYLPISHSLHSLLIWSFLFNSLLLGWLGGCLVETPFVTLSFICSCVFFTIVFLICGLNLFLSVLYNTSLQPLEVNISSLGHQPLPLGTLLSAYNVFF